MSIGTVQQSNYKPDYAGYTSTGDAKTDAFYRGMSSAVEEADERGTGDVHFISMKKPEK